MIKKIIFKDSFKLFKTEKNRFIYIILITLLSVAFYVGFKTTYQDMKISSAKYYNDTNLLDVKVYSSVGFLKSDESLFKNIKEINNISFAKTLNANLSIKNKNYNVKINSINSNRNESSVNKIILTSGKYPSTINEGLVEEKFLKDNRLTIGSLITLKPEDEESLMAKKIKIVGTVKSSYYSSKNNDDEYSGNNITNYYIYLEENDISNDYYNEVYITLKDARKLDIYKKEYDTFVNKSIVKIEEVVNNISQERKNLLYSDSEEKVKMINETLNNIYESKNTNNNANLEIKDLTYEKQKEESKLAKLNNPNIYVISRSKIPSFYEYKMEAERINSISRIFPLIFIIISSLIMIISISKTIEDDKEKIGMLKALGYEKWEIGFKYFIYTFTASFIGSFLGGSIFYKIIPKVISLYSNASYNMPILKSKFEITSSFVAGFIVISITTISSIVIFLKNYSKTPYELVRKNYNNKSNIISKKIKTKLGKLSFFNEVAIKNAISNKKMILLLIIGIGGCSTLLISAFGIKNSFNKIIDEQFSKINKYDAKITIKNIEENSFNNKNIKDIIRINEEKVYIQKNKEKIDTNLIITNKKINKFITLKNKKDENIKLTSSGVIVSEKLANILKLKVNNKIVLNTYNNKKIKVKVIGITKNYINHYIYITDNLYNKLSKENIKPDIALVKFKNKENIDTILKNNDVISYTLSNTKKEEYKRMVITLNKVSDIIIIISLILTIFTVYNLTNMYNEEKENDIISMKVTGYDDMDIIKCICKESIILIILSIILGLILGSIINYLIIKTSEINTFLFTYKINFYSYITILIIILLPYLINNILVYFSIKDSYLPLYIDDYE